MTSPAPTKPSPADTRRVHGTTLDARFAGLAPEPLRILKEAGRKLTSNQPDEADRLLTGVLAMVPDHPEALRLKAAIAHVKGRRNEAIELLQRAYAARPDDALILHHLAAAILQAGDVDVALPLLQRACELAPDLASAWINLATAYTERGEHDKALAAAREAVHCDPNHVPAHIASGNTLATLGRIDDAAAAYRAAIALQPYAGGPWAALGDLRTVPFTPAETTALEKLVADPSRPEKDRAAAGFALGRALEDAGRLPEAFAALVSANERWRRDAAWDRKAFSTLVERTMEAFSPAPAGAGDKTLGAGIVFIAGTPRSGTTLVEHILSAHPQVADGGERPLPGKVLDAESRRRGVPYPVWAATATPADWARLGREYLSRSAHLRGEASVLTDKALNNWLNLGALHAMLPGARFIATQRDPLATGWSIYSRLFLGAQPFAYAFDDIGAYLREHERLMRFWDARFPGLIHVHSLERLLDDPEHEVRALLAYCGLEYDPRCLAFHRNPRGVRNLSAAQVRQPLQRTPSASERYGSLLDPLRRSLAS